MIEARIGQKERHRTPMGTGGTRPTQPPISAYDQTPICRRDLYAVPRSRAAWRFLMPTTRHVSFILDDISQQCRRRRPCRAASSTEAGWHTTGKIDVPENIPDPNLLPSRAPERTESRTSGVLRRTGAQTPSSKTTTHHRRRMSGLGESHRLNPKRSRPSECANGLTRSAAIPPPPPPPPPT